MCFELIDDVNTDKRLKNLYSVILLTLKQKGRGIYFTLVKTFDQYQKLVDYALENNTRIGFDSCFAHIFMEATKNHPNFKQFMEMLEPCESSVFSSYINVKGEYWHCSFIEGHPDWKGVDVLSCNNFVKDIWYGEECKKFRNLLLDTGRRCPLIMEE